MAGTTLLMHILNGLAYGMLLFMIAAGLSIIFGLMHVVNLAHGTFLLGGRICSVFIRETRHGILAILASCHCYSKHTWHPNGEITA